MESEGNLPVGIVTGLVAGMLYGVYSAFLTLGMSTGAWVSVAAVVSVYLLGALGSAVNDTCSALWALATTAGRGKWRRLGEALRSKTGRTVIIAALIGGPLASSAYVVSLQIAGSIAIPITALCPAIGAILGRIFLRQPLTWMMSLGVAVCVAAGVLIGVSGGVSGEGENTWLGCLLALGAALGWGIEGVVGGYVTSILDPEVSVTLRQLTSGVVNFLVLVPLLAWLGGQVLTAPGMVAGVFTSWPAIGFIAIGALAAYWSFVLWYRGNLLAGTALGMAADGTYSFWGPLACWVLLGLVCGQEGWALPPIAWIGALVMCAGIFVIAFGARRAERLPSVR
jgi:drug/metabolite transporter (DMT)-like permease